MSRSDSVDVDRAKLSAPAEAANNQILNRVLNRYGHKK